MVESESRAYQGVGRAVLAQRLGVGVGWDQEGRTQSGRNDTRDLHTGCHRKKQAGSASHAVHAVDHRECVWMKYSRVRGVGEPSVYRGSAKPRVPRCRERPPVRLRVRLLDSVHDVNRYYVHRTQQ
jgi:hypothetical protein